MVKVYVLYVCAHTVVQPQACTRTYVYLHTFYTYLEAVYYLERVQLLISDNTQLTDNSAQLRTPIVNCSL